MKCVYCGQEVVLVPSAKERAAKYGGNPSDYTKLFTAHSECQTAAWYQRANPRTGEPYIVYSNKIKG